MDSLKDLVESQMAYHDRRLLESSARAEWLERAGSLFFALLLLLTLLQIPSLAIYEQPLQNIHFTISSETIVHLRRQTIKGVELLVTIFTSFSAAFLALGS